MAHRDVQEHIEGWFKKGFGAVRKALRRVRQAQNQVEDAVVRGLRRALHWARRKPAYRPMPVDLLGRRK